VVDVAAAIEPQGRSQLDQLGGVAFGLSILQLLLGGVQIVDVGLVVLLVVQLHDLPADDRLQGGIVVGQLGQGVLATHRQAAMG